MASFTAEEKQAFRFKKYVREHTADFFIHLAFHTALTEIVVYLCGGTEFLYAFLLAAAYTVGKWLYELHYFKKEWLEADIKEKS